jgi:hypothetical protein
MMSDDKLDIYGSPDNFKRIDFNDEELKEIDLSFPELHPHQTEFIEHLQAKIADAVGIGRGLTEPMLYISPPDPNMHRMMDMMADRPAIVMCADFDPPDVDLRTLIDDDIRRITGDQHIGLPVVKAEETLLIAESMIDAVKLAKEGGVPVLYVDSFGGFGGASFAKAMGDEFQRMTYVAAEPGSQAPNDLLHDERNVPKRFGNNKKWSDHRRQKAMAKASRRKNRKGK